MTVLSLDLAIYGPHPAGNGLVLPPSSSTIISGPTEAVVVDTPIFAKDVDALIARIDALGRRLTTIFITHAHGDHYFGLGRLLEHFPDAKAVSHPAVVASAEANHETIREQFGFLFDGRALEGTVVPSAMTEGSLVIDGEQISVILADQADTSPTALLWVPSISTLITGDVVYNGAHLYLAETGPDDWAKWIDSIDAVEALQPRVVVPGHQRPELLDREPSEMIAETRDYINLFADLVADGRSTDELIAAITTRYPDHANPGALAYAAQLAVTSRDGVK